MTRPDTTVNESRDSLTLLHDAPLSCLNHCTGKVATESAAGLSSGIAVLPVYECT